jgi:hypothetical protein
MPEFFANCHLIRQTKVLSSISNFNFLVITRLEFALKIVMAHAVAAFLMPVTSLLFLKE